MLENSFFYLFFLFFVFSSVHAQSLNGLSNSESSLVGGCRDTASTENGGSGDVDNYSDSSVCMNGEIGLISSKSGLYYDTAFTNQTSASAPSGSSSGGSVGISTTAEFCSLTGYNVDVSFSNCKQIETISSSEDGTSSYNNSSSGVTSSQAYAFEDVCNVSGYLNGKVYSGDQVVLYSGTTNAVGLDSQAVIGEGDAAFFNYPFNASDCLSLQGFNNSSQTCVTSGLSTANYNTSLNTFCEEAEQSVWKTALGNDAWSAVYSMCSSNDSSVDLSQDAVTYESCTDANTYVQNNPNATITPLTYNQVDQICPQVTSTQYSDLKEYCDAYNQSQVITPCGSGDIESSTYTQDVQIGNWTFTETKETCISYGDAQSECNQNDYNATYLGTYCNAYNQTQTADKQTCQNGQLQYGTYTDAVTLSGYNFTEVLPACENQSTAQQQCASGSYNQTYLSSFCSAYNQSQQVASCATGYTETGTTTSSVTVDGWSFTKTNPVCTVSYSSTKEGPNLASNLCYRLYFPHTVIKYNGNTIELTPINFTTSFADVGQSDSVIDGISSNEYDKIHYNGLYSYPSPSDNSSENDFPEDYLISINGGSAVEVETTMQDSGGGNVKYGTEPCYFGPNRFPIGLRFKYSFTLNGQSYEILNGNLATGDETDPVEPTQSSIPYVDSAVYYFYD